MCIPKSMILKVLLKTTVWLQSFFKIMCTGISQHKLREKLLVCPECGSNKFQVSILHCWKNEETDQLCEEGKLKYGFGANDRVGTKPETKRCLNCGCSWHNEAETYYWNEIVNSNGKLTKKILGI